MQNRRLLSAGGDFFCSVMITYASACRKTLSPDRSEMLKCWGGGPIAQLLAL
jgi:hypothetical protein